jgi:hypothetical protein
MSKFEAYLNEGLLTDFSKMANLQPWPDQLSERKQQLLQSGFGRILMVGLLGREHWINGNRWLDHILVIASWIRSLAVDVGINDQLKEGE